MVFYEKALRHILNASEDCKAFAEKFDRRTPNDSFDKGRLLVIILVDNLTTPSAVMAVLRARIEDVERFYKDHVDASVTRDSEIHRSVIGEYEKMISALEGYR